MTLIMLVWGAVLGSAANALIDRLPRGESWAAGRSKCDKCKHVLAWYDLIPLLSYLVLRGKCRYCGQKISWRNFFVELIMSVGFVTVYQGLGVSVQSVSVMGIMWVTTIIAIMDWETKLVSEVMVGLWAALVVVSRLSNLGDLSYLGGMAMGVVIIGGIWAISRGKAMGFGDVEIAAVMGYGLGWPKIAAGLWVAFVVGALVGVGQLVLGRAKLKSEMAFGPFLILGSWLGFFWGDMMWRWLFPF